MTDPTHSPDDLDEVLSAVLDGEADPATRARLASDPTAMARLEQLRQARDLVAAPVRPLDEMTARRLRQTAITEGSAGALSRSAKGRRPAAGRWIASAAAVLLLLVVAVPVLSRLTDEGDVDQTASDVLDSGDDAAESAQPVTEAAGADASADESGDSGAEMTTDPRSGLDLGAYGTDQAFGDAALAAEEQPDFVERSSNGGTPDDARPDDADGSPAVEELAQDLLEALDGTATSCATNTGSNVVASFLGTVRGETRHAHVVRDATGVLSVIVVDPSTCAVVATRP